MEDSGVGVSSRAERERLSQESLLRHSPSSTAFEATASCVARNVSPADDSRGPICRERCGCSGNSPFRLLGDELASRGDPLDRAPSGGLSLSLCPTHGRFYTGRSQLRQCDVAERYRRGMRRTDRLAPRRRRRSGHI